MSKYIVSRMYAAISKCVTDFRESVHSVSINYFNYNFRSPLSACHNHSRSSIITCWIWRTGKVVTRFLLCERYLMF
jgi:hypothetical protein